MSSVSVSRDPAAEAAVLAAALAGDETAFASLAERHRRELHVHCYRLLGSLQDAEDLVQETLLRAWRKRATFAGRSSFRAWLWSALEVAALLGTTVPSVNSGLQRARATLREQLPAWRAEWPRGADPRTEERRLLERYISAWERADVEELEEGAVVAIDGFVLPELFPAFGLPASL